MFVDPVFDGLRRTAKLASNLGDMAAMVNTFLNGAELNGKPVARCFWRHR